MQIIDNKIELNMKSATIRKKRPQKFFAWQGKYDITTAVYQNDKGK